MFFSLHLSLTFSLSFPDLEYSMSKSKASLITLISGSVVVLGLLVSTGGSIYTVDQGERRRPALRRGTQGGRSRPVLQSRADAGIAVATTNTALRQVYP
jgi:hypothetical protein